MNSQLNQVKKRAARYWFEDGLIEITIGFFFICIGITFLLQGLAEPGSFLAGVIGLVSAVLVVLGVFLVRPLLRRLKERLTYGRTRYVAYSNPSRLQRTLSVSFGVLMVGFYLWFILHYWPGLYAWLPFLEGLALATPAFIIGNRTGLIRFYLFALIMVILSASLALSGNDDLLDSALMFISAGILMVFSGVVVLISYLRKSQPRQEASGGS